MKSTVRIEPKSMAQFQSAMVELVNYTGQTLLDVALKNAALMCRESMLFTPPMGAGGVGGLTTTGQKAGMKSVERDVRKIYVASDGGGIASVYLINQQLSMAVKENNPSEFRQILNSSRKGTLLKMSPVMQAIARDYDDDRAFKKAKNYLARTLYKKSEYGTVGFQRQLKPVHQMLLDKHGGRFKIGKQPFNPVRSWRNRLLVQTDAEIMDYVVTRQAHVGRLKAGWWDAMMRLPKPKRPDGSDMEYGRAGVAPYIVAQSSGNGRMDLYSSNRSVNLVIGNMIGNLNGVADTANVKSIVLGLRTANLRADIEARMKKAAENFNNKSKK